VSDPNNSLELLFRHLAEKPTQWLLHYTGIETLLSILKSNKRALWLSNISYLNDAKELLHGHELMLKELKRREDAKNQNIASLPFLKIFADTLGLKRNTNSHMYVMSFSESGNSLNQWRAYTPHGKGISMSFDFTQDNEFLQKCGLILVKCLYEERRQVALVNELIDHVEIMFSRIFEDHEWPQAVEDLPIGNKEFLFSYQSALSTGYKVFSMMKHPAFEEEKEWRLIATKTNDLTEIDYRSGSNMLLPYFVAPIDIQRYLKYITVGPTAHNELSKDAIGGLLRKHQISIPIQMSKIPYREW